MLQKEKNNKEEIIKDKEKNVHTLKYKIGEL